MTAVAQEVEARPIHALIVDDHPLFRGGLAEALRLEPNMRVVAAVGSCEEAVAVARAQRIDVALVDVVLSSSNGIEVTRALKRERPGCRVLGLSALEEPVRVAEMLRAGADGFATKTQTWELILAAIGEVLQSHRYLSPQLDANEINRLARADTEWPLEQLTGREREVFQLLVRDFTNEQIAERLTISRRTVETHRQNLMRKLGVRSMVELVRLAVRHGA